ncbi:hypothetical protein JHK87_000989 [Glycine soja]|nr:hypothetical protein JHK87_000989 [Glycine soja]
MLAIASLQPSLLLSLSTSPLPYIIVALDFNFAFAIVQKLCLEGLGTILVQAFGFANGTRQLSISCCLHLGAMINKAFDHLFYLKTQFVFSKGVNPTKVSKKRNMVYSKRNVELATSGKGGLGPYIGICVLVACFGIADAQVKGGMLGDFDSGGGNGHVGDNDGGHVFDHDSGCSDDLNKQKWSMRLHVQIRPSTKSLKTWGRLIASCSQHTSNMGSSQGTKHTYNNTRVREESFGVFFKLEMRKMK